MCKQEPFSYQNPPKYRFISMGTNLGRPGQFSLHETGRDFYYGTCLPLRLRKDVVILLRANIGKMFALG